MKNKNFKDSRLIDAFSYIDPKYIAEVADSLKLNNQQPTPSGRFNRRGWRHIAALAACVLLLGAVIPMITYVLRHFGDLASWFPDDTTEESGLLTEPETPPEETTQLNPDTSAEDTTSNETTEPLYDGTTAEPEPEHNGSYGLVYKMNEDGKSAMLWNRGICTDENVIVASVWNGVPVTVISEAALADYNKYKTVTIPESVTAIDMRAFKNCTGLESIILHDGITFIGADAFENCELLKEITLPKSLEQIQTGLFANCINLEKVVIGTGVEKIVFGAFYDCSALRELHYLGTKAEWNNIEKESDWNTKSAIEVIHCSDGDVKLNSDPETTECTHSTYTATENVPMCTESATVNYQCSSCGYAWSETFPPLGHNYVNNICTRCGAEIEYDGSRGLEYSIVGDHSKVIGIGTCTDTEIVIPSHYQGYPVTQIEQWAFKDNTRITGVKIPDTVTRIGINAFAGCTSLRSIYISASVRELSVYSFDGCTNITSITIDPNNPYYEGTNCIIQKSNKSLLIGCRTTVIPADGSVERIDYLAFNGISGLYSITVPAGVIDIYASAFYNCPDLRELHLPSTLQQIGAGEANIIYGSNNIEVITIPKNAEYFYVDGNCLIERKTGILALGCKASVIPTDGTIKGIGRCAFEGNTNIKNIVLPEGITKIDELAFAGCENLKSIVFPKSLTEIWPWAFQNCTSLEKINLPEKVTMIYYGAFENCTKLAEVVLSNSLEKLYWSSFGMCPALSEIKFLGTKAEWNSANIDNYWNEGSAITVIRCSDGDINLRDHDGSQGLVYKFSDDGTYAILVGIGSGTDEKIVVATTYNGVPVKKIGSHAFSGSASFTEIVIPEGVTVIQDEAFYVCGNLRKVTLPSTLESIQDMAFMRCAKLERISIPNSVTNIGQLAFKNCINLISLTLGKGVELIEENAFKSCSSLDFVRFPKSLRLLAADAFASCTSLISVHYAGTIQEWNSVDSTGRGHGYTCTWYEGVPAAKISCTNGDIFIAPISEAEAFEAARKFLGIDKSQIGGIYEFAAKTKDPSHPDCYRVAYCEWKADVGYMGKYEVLREVYVNQNTGECREIVFDYPDIPEVFIDVIFNRETFTFVDKEYSSSGYTYKTEDCYLKTFELLPTCLFGAESQHYALLDIDGDSVPELVFSYSSSTYYGLILRYYEGKVYGYSFGGDGLMTDCTNPWHEGAGDVRGLDELYFDGLYLKSRELLRYDSTDPENVKYYVEGKETTKAEYEKFSANYDGEYLKYTNLDLYPVYVNPFPGG